MEHPRHGAEDRFGNPVPPIEATDLWLRFKVRRQCRQRGGHWWHSSDAMIGWACCQCGKGTDGMPRDGTSG